MNFHILAFVEGIFSALKQALQLQHYTFAFLGKGIQDYISLNNTHLTALTISPWSVQQSSFVLTDRR